MVDVILQLQYIRLLQMNPADFEIIFFEEKPSS